MNAAEVVNLALAQHAMLAGLRPEVQLISAVMHEWESYGVGTVQALRVLPAELRRVTLQAAADQSARVYGTLPGTPDHFWLAFWEKMAEEPAAALQPVAHESAPVPDVADADAFDRAHHGVLEEHGKTFKALAASPAPAAPPPPAAPNDALQASLYEIGVRNVMDLIDMARKVLGINATELLARIQSPTTPISDTTFFSFTSGAVLTKRRVSPDMIQRLTTRLETLLEEATAPPQAAPTPQPEVQTEPVTPAAAPAVPAEPARRRVTLTTNKERRRHLMDLKNEGAKVVAANDLTALFSMSNGAVMNFLINNCRDLVAYREANKNFKFL